MMHFVSCSFGKDSIATILQCLEHNESIDGAVFAEVMFDHSRNISGEIPEHIEWIYNTAIPKLEHLGVKTYVVKSQNDYISYFRSIVRGGGRHTGKYYGFPIGGMCVINRDCKIAPIKSFYRQFNKKDIVQYIGIAKDETKRLARLKGNQVSILAKYGLTEQDAKELCKRHGLLSPLYDCSQRGGCWFCPNCRYSTLQVFRNIHPELWAELETLSHTPNLCSYGFKYGQTFEQVNEKLDAMDNQLTLF